jgi:predicted HicB family RNase H-like nuclease
MNYVVCYRGLNAECRWDDEIGLFHGIIQLPKGTITFWANTKDELMPAMKDAVNDHYEFISGETNERSL